jgi:hypothetical protein
VDLPAPTTVRLPPELRRQLVAYCRDTGAVQNRVVVLALKSYLGQPTPALPVQRDFDEVERLHDVYRESTGGGSAAA